MVALIWIVLLLAGMMVLAYQRASLTVWVIGVGVLLLFLSFLLKASPVWLVIIWLIYLLIFLPLTVYPLRRALISRRVLALFRKVMPTMSTTEQEALAAGDVGWEGELFSGMPDWKKLQAMPAPSLSDEEQAFLDGPVEQLCEMIDSWKISRSMKVPTSIWNFLKKQGFFGLIIPKHYGGLEFSEMAHAEVIAKISGISIAVATVVSVPNSLGPAELLLRYGTSEQKDYYLPRLASGDEIPCFALTSPVAGSDAGSIIDYGIVCREKLNGEEQLAIRLTWDKRYITLAPVATLLGLAFKLYDPEHLLGDQEELGITCALIPTNTSGITIGRRHYPLDAAFPNGPTQGDNVLIPVDSIIGGRDMTGKGWRMLMECLAAGRSISLPSMAIGGVRRAVLTSGAYARIRWQFNTFIGDFGGVEEALVKLAGQGYAAEALRTFTIAMLDQGCKAAVASAISKCHTTEFARTITNHAMDIHGGKGICMGPNNYLAQGYIEAPISITVEGANILTRSMIIFGQGAIRCHPYILTLINAAEEKDKQKGLRDFDRALFGHLGFIISNKVRAFILGLTRGRFAKAPAGPLKRYYQQFSRFSAALAFTADMCMLSLGAELKRREKLSGRLGDLLSFLYMGSSALKYYEYENNSDELPLVKWVCQDLLFKLQTQLEGLLFNLPNRFVAWSIGAVVCPLGRRIKPPSDKLGRQVAELLLAPSTFRERLLKTVYHTPAPNNLIIEIEETLKQVIAAEPLQKKILKARRSGKISGRNFVELINAAKEQGIIDQAEADQMLAASRARMKVINVDDFADSEM